MKKKRILMIVTTPFYKEKGSSLRVYSILENLSKNYYIDLVTYSIGRDINLKNVNIIRTTSLFKPNLKVSKPTLSKLFLDFLILMKCFKLIFFKKYDIIHTEDFESAFIGYILSFLKKYYFVYDLHNRIIDNLNIINYNNKFFLYFILFLEKKIIKKVDLIILNWNIYYDSIIFKNKKKIIYYDKIELALRKVNLNLTNYVVYSGNSEPYQGIFQLIKYFQKLETDVKLVLVGNMNEEIKKYITENNLSNRIIMTGILSIKETNFILNNSLFCILPRIYGSQPSMKAIHYFISEKPILAKNIKANKELLIENFNCLYYKNYNDFKDSFNKMVNIVEKNYFEKNLKITKSKILNNWNQKLY